MNFCWHSYFGCGYDEVRCISGRAIQEKAPGVDTVDENNFIVCLHILFIGGQIIKLPNAVVFLDIQENPYHCYLHSLQ